MSRLFRTILSMLPAAALMGCAQTTASQPASAAELRVEFDGDSAAAYVAAQCAFGPRVPNTAAHSQCCDYLAAQLASRGATVTVQRASLTAYDGTRLDARNIIAEFNPDTAFRVMLLAHWDCRPWADNDPDPAKRGEPVMGANDGASGVAVLLELARQFSMKSPNIGVDILLVDAEDWGENQQEASWALGTQHWAKNMHRDSYHPAYAILLDMVGAPEARFCKEYFSMSYAAGIVNSVWGVAQSAGHSDYFPQSYGGAVTDDHLFINQAGIKCIDIIDHRDGTGFFEQWHTTHDTPDRVDPATLKAVGQTLANLIYQY